MGGSVVGRSVGRSLSGQTIISNTGGKKLSVEVAPKIKQGYFAKISDICKLLINFVEGTLNIP